MTSLNIRIYQPSDETDVIALWRQCNLVVPQNHPQQDILTKLAVQPELFFVGTVGGKVTATAMAGYDGHRGWINYLAVAPHCRQQGMGRKMVATVENALRERGCPKINVQIRNTNIEVIAFYQRIGFLDDHVIGMGKRLTATTS